MPEPDYSEDDLKAAQLMLLSIQAIDTAADDAFPCLCARCWGKTQVAARFRAEGRREAEEWIVKARRTEKDRN